VGPRAILPTGRVYGARLTQCIDAVVRGSARQFTRRGRRLAIISYQRLPWWELRYGPDADPPSLTGIDSSVTTSGPCGEKGAHGRPLAAGPDLRWGIGAAVASLLVLRTWGLSHVLDEQVSRLRGGG